MARPRFHPRVSSLFTPGSIARAMNNATSMRMRKLLRRWNTWRNATAPRAPAQNSTTARGTQRGMRRLSPPSVSPCVPCVAGSVMREA